MKHGHYSKKGKTYDYKLMLIINGNQLKAIYCETEERAKFLGDTYIENLKKDDFFKNENLEYKIENINN